MNTGVLLINLTGTELTDEEKDILQHSAIAGVLFFARNYESLEQLTAFCRSIRAVRQDLLICVDHEGGRVQRFKGDFTVLPPAAKYGELYQQSPDQTLALVQDLGWLMASELQACGVDLSLTPVVDLDLGKTDIVGDRAFGSTPEQVIALASAWINGMHDAGMSAILKHFPGHGGVDGDSHLVQPVDDRSFDDIDQQDLQTFKQLIKSGVEGVMPAHIVYSKVDDKTAGFSRVWQQQILRQQIGFDGLVVSDCLTMEGAASAGGYANRVAQALDAGCDLLILSNRQGVKDVLETSDKLSLKGRGPKSLLMKKSIDWQSLQSSARYQQAKKQLAAML